jgi:MOSC domain-containing protein YiiM
MRDLRTLMRTHARAGRVAWIGLRAARRAPMHGVARAEIDAEGLVGDHARPGKRAVTLIQAEHLRVIEALCEAGLVTPERVRRNVVVAGCNLNALRNTPLRLGGALVRITGPCAPCSRMEETLGPGGYSAMRGHGGWCAEVLAPGTLALDDLVVPQDSADSSGLA